jgi:hypothetical protein
LDRTIDLRHAQPTERSGIGRESARGRHRSLDPNGIAFLTLVNDETQYAISRRYLDALQIPSGYSVEKIAIVGATSMAEGYQRAMEASTAQYKIYVHQDVYLVHERLLPELIRLFRTYPKLGMVGVVGTTRMPTKGIWWVDRFHCFGRLWEFRRETGFPASFLGRRLHFSRFRSFTGDYLPAVAVDGLFIATQYDVPWSDVVGGFMFYEQVHSVDFIQAGLEVGIARQESIWCLHWGTLQERSVEQRGQREIEEGRRAAIFRQQYETYINVPARKLYERHRGAAVWRQLGWPPLGRREGTR